jgi:hypothetical protein
MGKGRKIVPRYESGLRSFSLLVLASTVNPAPLNSISNSTNSQPSLSTQFATATMQFTIMIKGFTLLTTSSIVYSPRLCSRISTYKYFCHVLPATLPADVSLQHRSIEGYAMETLKYKGEINDRAVQLEGAVRVCSSFTSTISHAYFKMKRWLKSRSAIPRSLSNPSFVITPHNRLPVLL